MPGPPAIGVLVPIDPGPPPPPPEQRPMGQAALALEDQGIAVVFGDRMRGGRLTGLRPRPGGWMEAVDLPVAAVFDRFPSQARAGQMAAIQAALGPIPLHNHPSVMATCRDKLGCQRLLEGQGLRMPPVLSEVADFGPALADWGAGFLKPRFGALGVGVERVRPGDPLPAQLQGVVPGATDPALLQRAVPPPRGWAGWCIRALLQREPAAGWMLCEAVLRCSKTDPVVNAARGAEVGPAQDRLRPRQQRALAALALRVGAAFDAALGPEAAIELGVDLVVDEDGELHVIEVNGRPRGRLEVLAQQDPTRFQGAHAAAIARPLRWLAWRHAGLHQPPDGPPLR